MRPPKIELERDGAKVVVQAMGTDVYLDAEGATTHERCFDEDSAAEAASARVAEYMAAGWRETAASLARREAASAQERAQREGLARHLALAEAASAAEAFAGYLSAFTEAALASRVAGFAEKIEDPTPFGFTVRLRGGGALRWSDPECFWLYLDERTFTNNDHSLYFGDEAGPPEEDAELEGTALEGEAVSWFLQELPWDRYWLSAQGSLWCYEFDGGLSDALAAAPLLELALQRAVHHLEARAAR